MRNVNFYCKLSLSLEYLNLANVLDSFAISSAIKIFNYYVPLKIIDALFKAFIENIP